MGNGLKLLGMAMVGYLFIMAAITGRPGSILEALFLPSAMIQGPYPGVGVGCNTGTWQTSNAPNANAGQTFPDKPTGSQLVPQNGQCPPTYHMVVLSDGTMVCRQNVYQAPGK